MAAGLGTRLQPLTNSVPKCLIPVCGRPILDYCFEALKRAGVDSVVLNTHHIADQVVSYLNQRKNFDIQVTLSHEPRILGTGGGLYRARANFKQDEPFFMVNADVYIDMSLSQLFTQAQASSALGTLLVMKREDSSYLLFDQNCRLAGLQRGDKQTLCRDSSALVLEAWGFCGIQVLRPEIFSFMPEGEESFSIIDTYLRAVREGAEIKAMALPQESRWFDMGTVEQLGRLEDYLRRKQN